MDSVKYVCKQENVLHLWTSITLNRSGKSKVKVKEVFEPTEEKPDAIWNLFADGEKSEFIPQFTCTVCNAKDTQPCKEHPYILLKDKEWSEKQGALGTLPWPLGVRTNGEGVDTVYTKADLPTRLLMGPYAGEVLLQASDEDQSILGWRISNKKYERMCVDASNRATSNWLRYVQCSGSHSRANLEIFQFRGYIYYATIRGIKKNDELLVWFGDDYAKAFDLRIENQIDSDVAPNADPYMAYELLPDKKEPLTPRTKPSLNPYYERCPLCHQKFEFYSEYESHKDLCVKIPCEYCNDVLPSLCNWFQHVLGHFMASWVCKNCRGPELTTHSVSKHCTTCQQCGRSPTLKEARSLLSQCYRAPKRTIVCEKCDLNVPSQVVMTDHLALHDAISKRVYTCALCQEILRSRDTLLMHMVTVHHNTNPYTCSHCSKGFKTKKYLENHVVAVHTDIRPYKCPECPKAYALKCGLDLHLVRHQAKSFPCTRCPKAFHFLSHLKKHLLTHQQEKTFKCDVCGISVKSKYNLERHMKSQHTVFKPVQCDECGMRFHRRDTLLQHKVVHTEKRKFQCTFCGRKFSQKGGLVRHMAKHDPDRPYTCHFCSECYAMLSSLKSHIVKHHPTERIPEFIQ